MHVSVVARTSVFRSASDDARPGPGTPRTDGGQVLVIFALFLIVLIGFAAVAVDLGSWLKVRRDYQNAADAAALAGSPFLSGPTPDRTSARHAAWNSLESQLAITISSSPWSGDTPAASPVQDSTGTYSMWVSTPPINAGSKYPGASTGSADKTIFVWIERQNPSYLARIFGINGSLVGAWATAGLFPNRYGVITLRQPDQAGPAQPDINLAGSGGSLTVLNGDVGGNYNMKLNSQSQLVLPGDSTVYLHDYVSCGQSCWGVSQITDGSGNFKTALQLPGPIPDPNYPLPTSVTSAPTAPITTSLPYGYRGTLDRKSTPGTVKVGSGGDTPAQGQSVLPGPPATCDGTKAVKIGPGYYDSITVDGSYCVILDPTLDPTYVHTCISGPPTCTDAPTPVPQGQMPGVFYINGTITVKGGGMLVGDGVTVVLRPSDRSPDGNLLTFNGGTGYVDLNDGSSPLVSAPEKSAAWTRQGVQPYTWDSTNHVWRYTSAYEGTPAQTGLALYVMRRDQIPGLGVASDDNSKIIQGNANAALTWNGITYAPHDNVILAGQPGHQGIGQLICWTVEFKGNTDVTQTYDGPYSAIPMLIEPRLGQP